MNLGLETPANIIALELGIHPQQVEKVIGLLDDGSTVPFIARYRKEITGGLDDTQLRSLVDRLYYLRELQERRGAILKLIAEQGKLTTDLEQNILTADTKTRLEDLYLPYRPKRQTKAQLAKNNGLEPLALQLLNDQGCDPKICAQTVMNPEGGVIGVAIALDGARQILIEKFAEDALLLHEFREYLWQHAMLKSERKLAKQVKQTAKNPSKKNIADKFADYFDYIEAIKKIPSHRALALFRGRRENVLQICVTYLTEEISHIERRVATHFKIINHDQPAAVWLLETIGLAAKQKILPKLETELLARLHELADAEAIKVFGRNLRELLLAAPAGQQVTLGLDPGITSGVKVVVVDATGKVLDYTVIFPFSPKNEWHQSIAELAKLIIKYDVKMISIGNGTGARETERLVSDLMKSYTDLALNKVFVSEAGASVYSASEIAAKEFPDLDVSIRGAVSIARRLQDPLAELVKIDPKAIGVGQYQHDVQQSRLARCLDGVVEDCVNAVGVDVNTASIPLLSRIAGLNVSLASNIIQYRNEYGSFTTRDQLMQVPRMGASTFQQAAGFLRIMHSINPLDASAVHPESYALVEKIAADQNVNVLQLMKNHALLSRIIPENYVNAGCGIDTVKDILSELEKPGRDPRPIFRMAQFAAEIDDIKQLRVGMIMEGVVSNVTNFGVFVDIGVHQDGLVHISEITNNFVTDPCLVVRAHDIVKVKIISIDKERRRIGLSMRLEDKQPSKPQQRKINKFTTEQNHLKPKFNTAMANAFAKLKQ